MSGRDAEAALAAAGAAAVPTPAAAGPDGPGRRFAVSVAGCEGGLEELVARAQRGQLDLAAISVSAITGAYREAVERHPADPNDIADFVALAARLVALKAAHLLPDGPIDAAGELEPEPDPADDRGSRLAEYRLFREAADALLAEAAESGMRSFLGLVAADVLPVERLAIAPERLAAAFRRVLERLPEAQTVSVAAVTFSVADKADELRERLRRVRRLAFDDVFAAVTSRLEAVAVFLALLELVRSEEATVDQSGPYGAITVTAVAA